jgi:hypothetical protein
LKEIVYISPGQVASLTLVNSSSGAATFQPAAQAQEWMTKDTLRKKCCNTNLEEREDSEDL